MTDRALYRLQHATARAMAVQHVQHAPEGYVVEIKPPTRSLEQNAKLHALLAEIAEQVVWYGQKLCVEDWKRVFAASLQKVRVVPGIDPGSFVPVGLRTRDMTIPEMSDMIELALAFGAEKGVVFSDKAPISIEKMRRG